MRHARIQILFVGVLVNVGLFVLTGHAYAGIIPKPANNLGLVGYWSLNEGNGTVAGDFSGNGNDGTLKNMDPATDWVNGRYGQALEFDGSDDYVKVDNTVLSSGNSEATISAWIYITGNAGNSWERHVDVQDGANSGVMTLTWDDDDQKYGFYGLGGDARIIGEDPPQNQWMHWVGVIEGGNAKFYFDGTLQKTDSTSSSIKDSVVSIGKRYDARDEAMAKIDDVRIYNRALSSSEVQDLYQRGLAKVKQPDRTGLVGYWSLNEGNGTVAGDFSGNGNDGTLKNMDPATDWVDGRYGQALDFDGGDDYVEVSDDASLDITERLTASVWVKPRTETGEKGYLIAKYNPSTAERSWNVIRNGNDIDIVVSEDGDANNFDSFTVNNILTYEEWQLITLVYNGSKNKVFRNDVLEKSVDSTISNIYDGAAPVTIGARADQDHFFNGQIDNVRIYDRALSANEIKALHQSTQHTVNASRNDQLTDGLQGMWSFDGGDMDWTATNEARDASGNDNHGNVQNFGKEGTAIGTIGQALEFDGSDDYVNAGNDSSLNITNEITLIGWAKAPAPSKDKNEGILGKGWDDDCSSNSFNIEYDHTSVGMHFNLKTETGGGVLTAESPPVTEDWHLMVGTYDGSKQKLYVDGQLDNSQSASGNITSSTCPVIIGAVGPGDANDFFNGKIDNVRIYNRALSENEIQRLYRMGK